MKKLILVAALIALSACAGKNDGYTNRDVWESNGVIYARADVVEKNEALCYNRARMNARDKVSNFINTDYTGKDNLKINGANESFTSDRNSETATMFAGATYLLKAWDVKTGTCGVEIRVDAGNASKLSN